MSKIIKEEEFEFKLSKPLLYQRPGGESKTEYLLLKCFSNKQRCRHEDNLIDMRGMLEKAYIKLIKEMADLYKSDSSSDESSKEPKEPKETKEDGMLFNMLLSNLSDKKQYSKMFWSLILDGLCFVDGKIPGNMNPSVILTEDLKNDISLDDGCNILAEYTKNFILPSWIKQQLVK